MTARRRPRVGLALGSGGARGWCHIGVLRGLDRMGLRPDVIAGASMGALVGAAYAGGRLEALADWACSQTRRSFLGMLDIRLTGGGIIGGAEIVSVLKGLGIPERIEDQPIPFLAVAADLETGREVWLRKGDIANAVRASVALPGIIAPHRIDGRWLIDGGVVNPVPVSAAHALGAEVVIAVDPNARMSGVFWSRSDAGPADAAGQDDARQDDAGQDDAGQDAAGQDDVGQDDAGQGQRGKGDAGARHQAGAADAGRAGAQQGWADGLRALVPGFGGHLDDQPPPYLDLVSTTIDIMTDQIRRSRLAGDAPHVLLGAQLSDMTVLEFHRAAHAIEEGERIVRRQADWIAACTGLSR